MDNKDFFDEEYDKVSESQSGDMQEENQPAENDALSERQSQAWYSYGGMPSNPTPPPEKKRGKKAMWISLVCVGLVLAILFGWVLCDLFGSVGSKDEKILGEVLDYLRDKYYQDISDEDWQKAIAAGGTAILQTAGDQFCKLMTPQELYDYLYQVEDSGDVLPTRFGVGFQFVNGLGLYVSQVAADGSSYGVLEEGDIVVKLSAVQYTSILPLGRPTEYDLSQCDGDEFSETLRTDVKSAKFHVLRKGEIVITDSIVRGNVGFTVANPAYDFQFIEFYFDDAHCNVSITNQNNAKTNTKALRHLDQLPADTGYIRISSFMYYLDDNEKEVTAADEFKKVMALFKQLGLKRLVLDLKDNPGGRVDAATDIAAMLATDAKLTPAQKEEVSGGTDKAGNRKLLLTTLVPKDARYSQATYSVSTYSNYFNVPTSSSALCDIVVWTDGGSASASELLTGVLRDYKTGFQIGTKTYGKGIAQSIERLPFYGSITTIDGKKSVGSWAIYYTSASYYSPLGENIHGDGYKPADGYSGITDYATLWTKTKQYWNSAA